MNTQPAPTEDNFASHIEAALARYFGFLSAWGYGPFEQEQAAREAHFVCRRPDGVQLRIGYEFIVSTGLNVQVAGEWIEALEPRNAELAACHRRRQRLYAALFDRYLKTQATCVWTRLRRRYARFGRALNERYLRECAAVLRRHPGVLAGDAVALAGLRALGDTRAQVEQTQAQQETAERCARKGLYRCEFVWEGMACECEAPSPQALADQLRGMDVSQVRVVDPQGEPVALEWPAAKGLVQPQSSVNSATDSTGSQNA